MASDGLVALFWLIFGPAGFIGFCCGLSRSVPAILIGAIVATVLQTLLASAVTAVSVTSAETLDWLHVLLTPVASLAASGIAWGAARLFFGPRDRPVEVADQSAGRYGYKHDILDPGLAEDP